MGNYRFDIIYSIFYIICYQSEGVEPPRMAYLILGHVGLDAWLVSPFPFLSFPFPLCSDGHGRGAEDV